MSRRNPPAIPADTTEEMWRLQMAAIARRSVADRLVEWAELNRARPSPNSGTTRV